MKKNLLIITAILLIFLLLIGLFFIKYLNNKPEEGMLDIEQIDSVRENVITGEEIPAEVSEEKHVQKILKTKSKSENAVQKAVKKVQSKFAHEEEVVERKTVNELEAPIRPVDYTPEEDEETKLLKKVPRTDEVVVDKEIKSRASKKYIFK